MVSDQPDTARRRFRPSLEMVVLGLAAGLVIATALAISANVASHLEDPATGEASAAMQAVVHAYVDPLLSMNTLDSPDPMTADKVNSQLELPVSCGQIQRIHIWPPNRPVVFPDLPALPRRRL